MTPRFDWVFLDVGSTLLAEHRSDAFFFAEAYKELRRRGVAVPWPRFRRYWREALRNGAPSTFNEVIRFSIERHGGDGLTIQEVRRALHPFHRRYHALQVPYADVRAALPSLAKRYRLGIIANQWVGARARLKRFGIDKWFEVWAISEELNKHKPDPALYRHALKAAGCPPDRAVMVGDRPDNDVVPARTVGMTAILLERGPFKDAWRDRRWPAPHVRIRSLHALAPALDRLAGERR